MTDDAPETIPDRAPDTSLDLTLDPGVQVMVQEWISLDGFAAGPGGEADLFAAVAPETSAAGQDWNMRLLPHVDEILLGRRTYELFAAYWPTADEPIAAQLNMARKTVASRTLSSAPWGAYPEAAVVPDAVSYVRERRSQGGKFLIWGSVSLVHALLEAGEVDELDLFIAPIMLGQGLRAFPERSLLLQLHNVRHWRGTLHARYRAVPQQKGAEQSAP
ncbi:dihydrofolate reductase family protein [Arthrobacter sp. Sa2CUA1]|uniref:Dihydrofolate reductase family protein n=1 Tax=Arthrobacter gallicola TaxID=2762225 RepID=A0ABR8UUK5_9MICC|nr:dihydrofolate reductase family protein [Arthrobacter gallicola]MBD7996209.1 dihydrofolate reductase family protein [Arthrobacter gallicola]